MATTATALEDVETFEDLLEWLGGVDPGRVRFRPTPGTATEADLAAINGRKRGIFELVDGVLVGKAMGALESYLTLVIAGLLGRFVTPRNLGVLLGPDAMMRLAPALVRAPDVAFVSWDRVPGGEISKESLSSLVPDLAVEVLSPSNTPGEMARKRREYFEAGVALVWEVDPRARTVTVFDADGGASVLDRTETLGGGGVLPGLVIPLASVFGELDRRVR